VLYRPSPTSTQLDPSPLRHRCRNPHCRGKLPTPVENPRDAFCARGCHAAFYQHRCLACEREMPRNVGNQKVCYRVDCKAAWRRKTVISRFVGQGSASVGDHLENPIKPGVKIGLNPGSDPGRPWRRVVGSDLTPTSFRFAIVSDGPNGQWAGGSFERAEAENRKRLNSAEQADGGFTDPDWREATSPDGVRCFVAPRPAKKFSAKTAELIASIPADLSIPNFLKRPNSAAAAAAERVTA